MKPSRRPPLVSVVTACYNAAPFVGETIASVLAQTHPATEHVVVDDGSTDASWEVVSALAARHPDRVRTVRLERNRGGCHARNRGAAEARGDFLLFLDADDVVAPETVAALVDAALGAPGALAVCEWAYLHRGEDGRWHEAPRNADLPEPEPEAALRGWVEGPRWSPTCALLWPRAVYEATGGWDESLARNQDGDIAMRALARGVPVAHAREGRGFYRLHGSGGASVSRSFTAETFRSQVRVLDRLAELLAEQGRLDAFAPSLGRAYQHTAWVGFRHGHAEVARAALRRGIELSGHRVLVSPRGVGQVLERLLGLEAKERLVQAARAGLSAAGPLGLLPRAQPAAGGEGAR